MERCSIAPRENGAGGHSLQLKLSPTSTTYQFSRRIRGNPHLPGVDKGVKRLGVQQPPTMQLPCLTGLSPQKKPDTNGYAACQSVFRQGLRRVCLDRATPTRWGADTASDCERSSANYNSPAKRRNLTAMGKRPRENLPKWQCRLLPLAASQRLARTGLTTRLVK